MAWTLGASNTGCRPRLQSRSVVQPRRLALPICSKVSASALPPTRSGSLANWRSICSNSMPMATLPNPRLSHAMRVPPTTSPRTKPVCATICGRRSIMAPISGRIGPSSCPILNSFRGRARKSKESSPAMPLSLPSEPKSEAERPVHNRIGPLSTWLLRALIAVIQLECWRPQKLPLEQRRTLAIENRHC